jgi:hypothetical protein
MWLTFKKIKEDWQEHPAFFFEITPSWSRYGMGFYSASAKAMQTIRDKIDADTLGFKKTVLKNYKKLKGFSIEGDQYKKSKYMGDDKEIAEWYNRKNLFLVYNGDRMEELYDVKIIEDMRKSFLAMAEIYAYLCEITVLAKQ